MIEHIEIPKNEEETQALLDYLHEQQSEDIAEYIANLDDRNEQLALLRIFSPDDVAIILFELEDASLMSDLLLSLPHEQGMAIADEIATDDAADLIADMAEDTKENIFSLFDQEVVDDIQELLDYDEETAGGLMTTEFVVVPAYASAEKAIDILRSFSPEAETIYYVYVIDELHHLVGILSLRELIIAPPDAVVEDIMHQSVIAVNVHDDQEKVASQIAKYNFLAIPVIDDEQHIVGIVTVDDIVDVIQEEATEDIYRMAGIGEGEEEEDSSVLAAFKARVPWLIVTIAGGLCSGSVLAYFSDKLSTVIALTFFVPLIIGLAGNVGTQSSTVTVRSIATGALDNRPIWRVILKESLTGLVLGLSLGVIVAGVASVWQQNMLIGIAVGITIFLNNMMAALMGALVPLVLKQIKIDPAVASAPFITTVIDIMGLINYSIIAAMILNL